MLLLLLLHTSSWACRRHSRKMLLVVCVLVTLWDETSAGNRTQVDETGRKAAATWNRSDITRRPRSAIQFSNRSTSTHLANRSAFISEGHKQSVSSTLSRVSKVVTTDIVAQMPNGAIKVHTKQETFSKASEFRHKKEWRMRVIRKIAGLYNGDSRFEMESEESDVVESRLVVQETSAIFGTWGDLQQEIPTYGNQTTSEDRLMIKLIHSAILRDNLVTMFGFMLNRPNNPIPVHLYASLFGLYDHIRLRRVRTIDLLPSLKTIMKESPHNQLKVIFLEIRESVPKYLHSITAAWIEALGTNLIDVNDIVQPNGGALLVNILASINPRLVELFEENIDPDPSWSQLACEYMGNDFGHVFAKLSDGSMRLTPQLFAFIFLHLPLDGVVPHSDETGRFILDALRVNGVQPWDEISSDLTPDVLQNPFDFVRLIFRRMAMKSDDQIVRDSALFILPYIREPTATFLNPAYKVLSPILSKPNINFIQLLKAVIPLEYPDEIVNIRDRMIEYILDGYIDLEMVNHGFIRYDYSWPVELLSAILLRIQYRIPNLAEDIRLCAAALHLHLELKMTAFSLSPVVPTKVLYLPYLLVSYTTPDVPAELRETVKTLTRVGELAQINWEVLGEIIPLKSCTHPRQCTITMLIQLMKRDLISDDRTRQMIQTILSSCRTDGEIVTQFYHNPDNIEMDMSYQRESNWEDESDDSDDLNWNIPRQTVITDVRNRKPIAADEIMTRGFQNGSISGVKRVKLPSFYNEHVLVTMPIVLPVFDTIPAIPQRLDLLLPVANPGTHEHAFFAPLRTFLMTPDIKELMRDFDFSQYPTNGKLIRALLAYMMNLDQVKEFPELLYTVRNFLNYLEGKPVDNSLPTDISSKEGFGENTYFPVDLEVNAHQDADLEHLEYLIPYAEPFSPADLILRPIRKFLTEKNLLMKLGPNFHPEDYRTKGRLIRAILESAMELDRVKYDVYLFHCVRLYAEFLSKVKGYNKVVNYEFLLNSLPPSISAEEDWKRKLLRSFLLSKELGGILSDRFDSSQYPTIGMLLKNILYFIVELDAVRSNPPLYEAVNYFIPRVMTNGVGASGIQYLVLSRLEKVTVRTLTANFTKLFRTIDLKHLNKKQLNDLEILYQFFSSEFEPKIHADGFDLMAYRTKGEFLQAYFKYLIGLPAVSDGLKQALQSIVGCIRLDGIGSTPIE